MTDPLRQLVRELHRPSHWQVLAAYLVAAWAVFHRVAAARRVLVRLAAER